MSRYRVFSPVLWNRCRMYMAVAISLLTVLASAHPAFAQTPQPLNFKNNFFVTGDYVVAGWAGKTASVTPGYATGTISIPDITQYGTTGTNGVVKLPQPGVVTQVPAGADIVAAWLYWTTVEKSQSASAGQTAYIKVSGHPKYQFTGLPLDQSAPVSWSSGGCSGSANGTTTMKVYRADVRAFLPVANGMIQPNTDYTVELADSNTNGNTAPFTLGATLVIVYRVLSPNAPLTAVVIYDGAFAPANGSTSMTQQIQGFYQPGVNSGAPLLAKLTHIVGNGQPKKQESASMNSQTPNLPSLYSANGGGPAFPGIYNGSWDNPTWNVNSFLNTAPNDFQETISVAPGKNNGGCVSWGAVIFSTTVQDTDGDGLLDYWEETPSGGNVPAAVNPGLGSAANPNGYPGYIDVGTGQFVSLRGADPLHKDIFIQLDSMCNGTITTNADYSSTCGPNAVSFAPPPDALTMMTSAFAAQVAPIGPITVHYDQRNAIPEQTCQDSTDASGNKVYCSYPNQPGVVVWKDGFSLLKNQPVNLNADGSPWTETQCEQSPACVRRFQSARKDSYHYMITANALGGTNWNMGATLTSISVDGNGLATFTTTSPPAYDSANNHTGLIPNDKFSGNGRVSVVGAITAPALNGIWFVQSASNTPASYDASGKPIYTFTAQTTVAAQGTYDVNTDPNLGVASGKGGTGSGLSDGGGADSLVTLGLWDTDGQPSTVQAGTVMHELGHTLSLPHGGAYSDGLPNSYALTLEGNCKSNYQSVMNYMFQVDLLTDSSGNPVLDYSEQELKSLIENSLPAGVTATDGSSPLFSITQWYTSSQPIAGTPAKRHCDGTLILPTDPDPPMYRSGGAADPITPGWASSFPDVNFDGTAGSTLRGFYDWGHVDLRQIGATGSLSTFGGGGASAGLGGGGASAGFGGGGASAGFGGGGSSAGFGGVGELTREAATSFVRPPKQQPPQPSDTRLAHSVTLHWTPPIIGQSQIAGYHIYRGDNGATPSPYVPTTDGTQVVTGTSYTDSNVTPCHTYTYFETSVVLDATATNGFLESYGSNSVTYVDPCPPLNATSPANASTQVTVRWTPPQTVSSMTLSGYKVYRATGDTVTNATAATTCTNVPENNTSSPYTPVGSTDVNTLLLTDPGPFTNNTCYSYVVTALYANGSRESYDSNTTSTFIHVTVNPNVTTLPTPGAITFGQMLSASTLTGGVAVDPNNMNVALAGGFTFQNPTFVPPVGSYAATVVFTPTDTFNYNTVTAGPVYVAVNKAATTTTITGTVASPNPPLLGQTITVNFKVTPAGANGTVTVKEDAGATCTGAVTANGTGSCLLTLSVLTSTMKSAVGNRALTATYSGDSNYAQSSTTSAFMQQVVYKFVGFLSPLSGTGTYVGSMNLGKVLPIKWQLPIGTSYITMTNLNPAPNSQFVNVLLQAIYNGPAVGGKCTLSPTGTASLTLFTPTSGVAWPGNSNFRYDSTNNQFNFNWDTSVNVNAGCYTLVLLLDDAVPQPPNAATSSPIWATSVQLK